MLALGMLKFHANVVARLPACTESPHVFVYCGRVGASVTIRQVTITLAVFVGEPNR